MKFNKLKDESGSAMLLAIFLVVLVSIVIISFSTQVGNQIKSTMRSDDNIQEKYDAESDIEEGIAEFIENIQVTKKLETWTKITHDEKGNIIEIPMNYEYYIITYDNSIVKEIEVNPLINSINSNSSNIIIDADSNLDNNKPDTENKPNGNIDSIITIIIEFVGEVNEKSQIKIKISDIVNEINYKVSYSVLSWRNK